MIICVPSPRYKISKSEPVSFSWAFQKVGWEEDVDPSKDYSNSFNLVGDIAKIYSINVTNTLDGGAVTCKQCPMGASISG